MTPLSEEDILQIRHSVEATGIRYYDVQLELIDHIASAIECNDDDLSFAEKLKIETAKWDVLTLKTFVESKEKELRRYWYRRAKTYFLRFWKPPAVGALISLTLLVYTVISIQPGIVTHFSGLLWALYCLWILFSTYKAWLGLGAKPLMVKKAYYESIAGLFSIGILLDFFDGRSGVSIFSYHPLLYAVVSSLVLLMIYASIFVFPKWLREEMSRYRFAVE